MSQTTEESRKGLFSKHSSDDRKAAGAPINGAPQQPPPPPPVAGAASAAASPGVALKVIVKSADMKEEMQKDAVECALSAVEKHNVEKDIAEYVKKEFDRKYGSTWHCIVGRNFGSYVTHETNHFVYFYLDQKAILLFKSG